MIKYKNLTKDKSTTNIYKFIQRRMRYLYTLSPTTEVVIKIDELAKILHWLDKQEIKQ